MIHHRDVLLGVAAHEGDWGPKSGEADQGRMLTEAAGVYIRRSMKRKQE